MDFDGFIHDIESGRWNVFGTQVWQNGQLLHAWGDTQENRHPIYSCTKTVTSIAAGMAWDDGHIDLNRCVLDYLPTRAVAAMMPAQREAYKPITLHRLMTMSVPGYPFRPEGDSWLDFALACPLADTATPAFEYSNIPAYLTAVAVTHAVDEDLDSYLSRRLFAPLGIDHPLMSRCPEGYFYGASGMALTVDELSRIGMLLMNGGHYADQCILSNEFIHRATSVQQMCREGGYGYFVWKYRDGFSINGKWGQKCYVLPQKGLLVTHLAHNESGSDAIRESLERYIFDL